MKRIFGFTVALCIMAVAAHAAIIQDFEGSGAMGVVAAWGSNHPWTAGRSSGGVPSGSYYGRCERSPGRQGESIYGIGTGVSTSTDLTLSGYMRTHPDKSWAGDPANWCWYELDYAWGNHDSQWCMDNGGHQRAGDLYAGVELIRDLFSSDDHRIRERRQFRIDAEIFVQACVAVPVRDQCMNHGHVAGDRRECGQFASCIRIGDGSDIRAQRV